MDHEEVLMPPSRRNSNRAQRRPSRREPEQGRSPPKRRRRKRKPVQQVHSVSTIDWYTQGYNRGMQWKAATSRRKMTATAEEVHFIAERMTADYVNKGIDAAGEQRFIKGFKAAVNGN
jgi:hypothetical protein